MGAKDRPWTPSRLLEVTLSRRRNRCPHKVSPFSTDGRPLSGAIAGRGGGPLETLTNAAPTEGTKGVDENPVVFSDPPARAVAVGKVWTVFGQDFTIEESASIGDSLVERVPEPLLDLARSLLPSLAPESAKGLGPRLKMGAAKRV